MPGKKNQNPSGVNPGDMVFFDGKFAPLPPASKEFRGFRFSTPAAPQTQPQPQQTNPGSSAHMGGSQGGSGWGSSHDQCLGITQEGLRCENTSNCPHTHRNGYYQK